MTRIVPMTNADVEACASLVARDALMRRYGYGAAAARRDLAAALADAGHELLIARGEEGELLGFAWLVLRGAFARSAYLKLIVVDTTAARRGVGRALMEALEARHLRPAGLMLLCSADNDGAAAFYRRLGYAQVGRIPEYTGAGRDELIFYKAAS